MKQDTFCRELKALTPGVPAAFHQQVEDFLSEKVAQENQSQHARQHFRLGGRAMVLALAALLLMGTVAMAATNWGIFDTLAYLLGEQPISNNMQMEKILHQETTGSTDITILEAGYDGRTLLLQYSCRSIDGTQTCADWWTDRFWVNGVSVDMPADSGADFTETETPGEVVRTDYIRLDNENIRLSGRVTIGLPLVEKPDMTYFKSLYDVEVGRYAQPEQGLVVFSFDAGDVLSRVETFYPNVKTVTDVVAAKVTEAAFSPLMTYITLELTGNPDALADYKQEHGEGYYNENAMLLWPYTSIDVHSSYLSSLTLVDENGTVLFPDHSGNNGMGDTWAEYLFPYIPPETMPKHLYLAPVSKGVVNMEDAIFVR